MKNTQEGLKTKLVYLFPLKKLYQSIMTQFFLLSSDLVVVPAWKRGNPYSGSDWSTTQDWFFRL